MRRTAWAAALLLATACETTRPAGHEPLLAKADDLFLQESYSQAAGQYEAFLSYQPAHERRAEIRVRVGKCQLAMNRPDRALEAFDRALASQPSPAVRTDAQFRKGVALRQLGQATGARDALRAVAAAPAGDRDAAGITADEVAYETAQACFRAGDWKGGQAELGKLSPQGPYDAKARTRVGLTSYAVQIGAFADEAQARSTAARAPGAVVRAAPGSPPLHIVSVGAYPRYEDAQGAAERLKGAGFKDAFVIP